MLHFKSRLSDHTRDFIIKSRRIISFLTFLTSCFRSQTILSFMILDVSFSYHWHICRTCHSIVHEGRPGDHIVQDSQHTELQWERGEQTLVSEMWSWSVAGKHWVKGGTCFSWWSVGSGAAWSPDLIINKIRSVLTLSQHVKVLIFMIESNLMKILPFIVLHEIIPHIIFFVFY